MKRQIKCDIKITLCLKIISLIFFKFFFERENNCFSIHFKEECFKRELYKVYEVKENAV